MMQSIYRITKAIRNRVAKLNEKGQGMVEYAVILAVVAAVAIIVFGTGNADKGLGETVSGAFKKANDNINKVGDEATSGSQTPESPQS